MLLKKGKIKNLGFVLLFSLLISSILLATGLGISRLMVRQISLASLSRDSQVAFFTADSGMECARFWNIYGKFDTAPSGSPDPSRSLYCNGQTVTDGQSGYITGTGNPATCEPSGAPPEKNVINGTSKSCFTLSLNNGSSCAFVIVDKSIPNITTITSNGYSKCNFNAPNILQRTLETTIGSSPQSI